MTGWFGRRVVRAELRDDDIVSSTGASVVRYGQYLGEGRAGRVFWIVASVTQLAVFVGLPFVLVWSVWDRSELDRADPTRMASTVSVALVSWWCRVAFGRVLTQARPSGWPPVDAVRTSRPTPGSPPPRSSRRWGRRCFSP